MNIAEAHLLQGGVENLSHNLLQNRVLRQQKEDAIARRLLAREAQASEESRFDRTLRERQGEHIDTVMDRESSRKAQEQANNIQADFKAAQEKHYQQMESLGLFDKISQGLQEGTIDIEQLQKEAESNPMFQRLGLGVKLFKQPAQAPTSGRGVAGPIQLQEQARRLEAQAQQARASGDEATAQRFEADAKELRTRNQPTTPKIMVDQPLKEGDDLGTGPRARVPMTAEDLEKYKAKLNQPSGAAPASPQAQPGQVARPTTQAEFDALPDGTPFINPADGSTRIKGKKQNAPGLLR